MTRVRNVTDAFSLLFYLASTTYVVFGIYTLLLNPASKLNRVFFAVCLSLSIWAFALSMGNAAPDYETALLWRRVCSVGWGTMFCLMLHFFLLLTENKCLLERKTTYLFLYMPALINIVFFGLYGPVAKTQYALTQIETGWINVSPKGLWDLYFNMYFMGFSLMALYILWHWRDIKKHAKKKMTALIINMTFLLAIGAGTLTDVVINTFFSFKTPQLGVVFAIIPLLGIYYSIKRHGLMTERVEMEIQEGEVLGKEKRLQLYRYVASVFIVGSILNISQYFYFPVEISSVIQFSALLLLMSAVFGIIPLTKIKKSWQDKLLYWLLSLSIVIVFMHFAETYGNNIVWPVPLIFMLLSAVFRRQVFLLMIVLTAIFTQCLIWLRVPEITVRVAQVDYLSRLVLYALFGLLTYYINRIYQRRLQENQKQNSLQRLMSDISTGLVRVDMDNLDDRIHWLLQIIGQFFALDRAWLFLCPDGLRPAKDTYEWCAPGITPASEQPGEIPLEAFHWWMKRMSSFEPLVIRDVSVLPDEEGAARTRLEAQNVKSLMAIPVIRHSKVMGYLRFDSVRTHMEWEVSEREILKIMANALSDTLVKVEAEKEINRMAYYDMLTGLANRVLFKNQLEKAISLAGRSEKFLGILFLDLDSFKAVNDAMGHAVGDLLLKEIAQRFLLHVRQYDTVCRFGGDEFLVMFPQMDSLRQIEQAGDNLMSVFKDPVIIKEQEFFVTASAGISVYPADGMDAEALVKSADLAMYAAKDLGKNQITFCSTFMKETIHEKMRLTNDLYRAMERDELLLYYQPQLQIETGRIVGMEALIRWQHPERGMISPASFIPLAEQTGLIHPIGEWVLRTACHQNKIWQDMGFDPVVMAVNLSVEQFRTPHLTEVVARVLQETELSAAYLELEITEGIAIRESDYIIPILNQLKAQGVAISIDDFGTEYSSLSRLKQLPIDRIKMAMEFVQGINKGTKDEAIAMIIINLAKTLGLRVIAEGVETEGQFAFLTKGVCDEVQGYYFHRPMPAVEMEKILRRQSAYGL